MDHMILILIVPQYFTTVIKHKLVTCGSENLRHFHSLRASVYPHFLSYRKKKRMMLGRFALFEKKNVFETNSIKWHN